MRISFYNDTITIGQNSIVTHTHSTGNVQIKLHLRYMKFFAARCQTELKWKMMKNTQQSFGDSRHGRSVHTQITFYERTTSDCAKLKREKKTCLALFLFPC